jgi:hypothetical protein
MRYLKLLVFVILSASFAACSHPAKNTVATAGDNITATGTLQRQGFTTYMYGTHVLNGLVLKSSTIDLDPYVGQHVRITAVNLHYQAEMGPELYDVLSIILQ